jgi:Calpain family cysteine protease
MFDQR